MAAKAKTKAAEDSPQRLLVVTSSKGLNLRVGPHQSFQSLTVLENGSTLVMVELPDGVSIPGWIPVCQQGDTPLTGWVSSAFVTEA